ncbi:MULTISPECIES: hypothetical protein [unclassified Streptomyces]|uniref:hypothetical protein n=1 Tax=unclassified Streptomyces TaxID=2593676 RepID=UPI0033DFD83C
MNAQSEPAPKREGITPDALLHTGAGGDITAEDLVLASGRDITPKSLEWAERRLEQDGTRAIDKLLP